MKKVLSTIVTAALFFTATAQNTIPLSSALTAKKKVTLKNARPSLEFNRAIVYGASESKNGYVPAAGKSAVAPSGSLYVQL